jgi:integrase
MDETTKYIIGSLRVTEYLGRKNLYLEWRGGPSETQQRQTTGTSSWEEAERAKADFIEELIAPPPVEEITVREYLDAYEAATGKSKWECLALRTFFIYQKPDSVRSSTIKDYIKFRMEEGGVQQTTAERELRILRAAGRWAANEERMIDRPPEFKIPDSYVPLDRVLSKEDVEALWREAQKYPHLAMFVELYLATGQRSGRILNLHKRNVNLITGTMDFRRPGDKNKKGAVVPIPPEIVPSIEAAIERSESGYLVEYMGHKIGTINAAFQSAVQRAGIEHCTPRDLRRTVATWMDIGGADIRDIAALLGHTNTTITSKVYALGPSERLKEIAGSGMLPISTLFSMGGKKTEK